MRTLQDEYSAIHKLLNYIQIEGDVGDEIELYKFKNVELVQTKQFRKLVKDARNALNRLEKQK